VIYMRADFDLKFLATTVSKIWIGSQNCKNRSLDHYPTPFDQILHFAY